MTQSEVLLVDDGSKDDTLSIAQKYAARDARIQVLHQDNAGVSAARNRALGQAKGEWATFVDGDDILPPNAFETLLSGAGERVDLVVCPHETFDETGHSEPVFPETQKDEKTVQPEKAETVGLCAACGAAVCGSTCFAVP